MNWKESFLNSGVVIYKGIVPSSNFIHIKRLKIPMSKIAEGKYDYVTKLTKPKSIKKIDKMIFCHGTTDTRLNEILQEGLVPNKKRTFDSHNVDHWQNGVYLAYTPSLNINPQIAVISAVTANLWQKKQGNPIIIYLKLKEKDIKHLTGDLNFKI
jgi:hypothetical protein